MLVDEIRLQLTDGKEDPSQRQVGNFAGLDVLHLGATKQALGRENTVQARLIST